MNANAAAIGRFYAAFDRRDYRTMAGLYTVKARFSDPVFPELVGPRIGSMWRMLCARATDLRVECGPVRAEGDAAHVEWQAWYTYSAFDLYRWARQALGIKGMVLGWAPPVQQAIRRQASRTLDAFAARIGDGEA
jgi:hypothetical protein